VIIGVCFGAGVFGLQLMAALPLGAASLLLITLSGFGTIVSSMLLPRVDDGRVVLLHNRWYNAEANVI